MTIKKKHFVNILGKGEHAGNHHYYAPFKEAGVYCFALVGPSVGLSVDHIFVQSITQKVFQVSS